MNANRITLPICMRGTVVALIAVAIATIRCLQIAPAAIADDIVVIVHRDNPSDAIDVDKLRRIYRGDQKKWPGGGAIVPILPDSGSQAMDIVLDNVFVVGSEDDIARYYMAAIFQQKITDPPESLMASAAVSRVGSTPGAIAIVPMSAISDAVLVIEVEGLSERRGRLPDR